MFISHKEVVHKINHQCSQSRYDIRDHYSKKQISIVHKMSNVHNTHTKKLMHMYWSNFTKSLILCCPQGNNLWFTNHIIHIQNPYLTIYKINKQTVCSKGKAIVAYTNTMACSQCMFVMFIFPT